MATVTSELRDGLQVEIVAGAHRWTADEPVSVGGTDTGPTPYDLLLGALAACTVMTLRLYCDRKSWPLDGVTARFTHDRVHARDCEDCDDDATGYLDRIRSDIEIEGAFDDEQRARLQQVAVRCPVHRTLERAIHFEDRVAVS